MKHPVLLTLLIATAATVSLAQEGGTIEPNPDAVLLKRIWTVTGENEGDFVGAGSVGDINGDGIGDFAVHFGTAGEWQVYLGESPQPSTDHVWSYLLPGAVPSHPVVGDFFGTGENIIGFSQFRHWENPNRYVVHFFRPTNGELPDTPFAILDPWVTTKPEAVRSASEILASDLDGDGDDELIIAMHAKFDIGGSRNTVGEIWVYEGGENFQVNTPTLVIKDTEENHDRGFYLSVGDFDGDGFNDLALSSSYDKVQPKIKFWWGDNGSPWNWQLPHHILILSENIGINTQFALHDLDGDSIPDLAGNVYGTGSDAGAYIYLSSSGKNIRSRSFTTTDADIFFPSTEVRVQPLRVGYLNDSLKRYEMLLLTGPGPNGEGSFWQLFSGDKNGLNRTYDAFYSTELDGLVSGGILLYTSPVGDVNGDGWDDFLTANPDWGGFDRGVAIIVAGGSYITTDDATTNVPEMPIADESPELFVWPNPVRDHVNIVWRGNLPTMPVRFEMFDPSGKRITPVNPLPFHRLTTLTCSDVSAGTYILVAYDAQGRVIASTWLSIQ